MPLNSKKKEVVPVITLDGPSGSGKGTVAALLAERLGWRVLDSGVVYRALALLAMQRQTDDLGASLLAQIARQMSLTVERNRVEINGIAVTNTIRTPEVASYASKIAVFPEVREALTKFQQEQRKPPGLVADGRDMGTEVFKDAILKVFLTASEDERVRRRYLQAQMISRLSFVEVRSELLERDRRDVERAISPLRPALDAIVIDTTGVAPKAVCELILEHLSKKREKK